MRFRPDKDVVDLAVRRVLADDTVRLALRTLRTPTDADLSRRR